MALKAIRCFGGITAGTLASGSTVLFGASPIGIVVALGLASAWIIGEAYNAKSQSEQAKQTQQWLEQLVKKYGSLLDALSALDEGAEEDIPEGVKLDRIRKMAGMKGKKGVELEAYVLNNQSLLVGLTEFAGEVMDILQELREGQKTTHENQRVTHKKLDAQDKKHDVTHEKLDEILRYQKEGGGGGEIGRAHV